MQTLPVSQELGKKAKRLADADYEKQDDGVLREMHRVLADDGVLTVMFTHKQVDAWDTLGTALIRGRIPSRFIVASPHRERAQPASGQEECRREHDHAGLP